jgi:hypothetical protein
MPPRNEAEDSKRREPRREVELGAVVLRNDGSRSVAELSDISYEGCQLRGGPELEPAERIRLLLPCRGETIAHVRWTEAGKSGARFEADDGDHAQFTSAESSMGVPPLYFGSGRTFGRKGAEREAA